MQTKQKISFIGYSGHSYICIEIAKQMNFDVIGYYEITQSNKNYFDLTYLGREDDFEANEGLLFCSIGDNLTREKIYNKISKIKIGLFALLKHPTAIVSATSSIGDNTLISAGAIINALSVIETGCIINTGAIVEHDCTIKAFAHIAPGAVIAGNVTVGNRSFVGAGSVVKQGVRIGNDVIIGAGAVVIKDVSDNQIVAGNPAKPLNK